MQVLDSLFPLGSFVAKTFGDCAIGEVVGLNYVDETVTVYFYDENLVPMWTSWEETISYKGLRPVPAPE